MKKIVISQRVMSVGKGAKRDCLEQDYIEYYQRFDSLLIPLPNAIGNLESYLHQLNVQGIILSGGNDIHPRTYGGLVQENKDYDEDRDKTEKKLMDFAISRRLPVLGECRGMQFINVYFGGKLRQGIKNHVVKEHEIEIVDESFKKYLKKNNTRVNSFHNNGIYESDLSEKLKIFAKSPDGNIEGFYHKNLPILGIMWHPERKNPDDLLSKSIIELFIKHGNYIV